MINPQPNRMRAILGFLVAMFGATFVAPIPEWHGFWNTLAPPLGASFIADRETGNLRPVPAILGNKGTIGVIRATV